VEGLQAGKPFACRVLANPLGYHNKGEQETFREALAIEVPAHVSA
jgi:hypothetical protein